jgi:hypothetical protein
LEKLATKKQAGRDSFGDFVKLGVPFTDIVAILSVPPFRFFLPFY